MLWQKKKKTHEMKIGFGLGERISLTIYVMLAVIFSFSGT